MVILKSTYVSSTDSVRPVKQSEPRSTHNLHFDAEYFMRLMSVIRERRTSLNEFAKKAIVEYFEESVRTNNFNLPLHPNVSSKNQKPYLIKISYTLNMNIIRKLHDDILRRLNMSVKNYVLHIMLNKIDSDFKEYNIQIDKKFIIDSLTVCRMYSSFYVSSREENVKRYKKLLLGKRK